MLHIKSFIFKFLQRNGIKNQVEAAEICRVANRIFEEIFGSKSRPWRFFFRNHILQVKCSNSILANEVQLRREQIKNQINKEFGREIIKIILTKIG